MKNIKAFLIALVTLFSVHRQTACMCKLLHSIKHHFSTYKLKDLASHFKFLDQNKKNNLLIFIGPPASGKGTVSKICVNLLDWQHIAPGELCREQMAQQTALGKQIDISIKLGNLIDDNLMLTMIKKSLKKSFIGNTLAILDGLPRTPDQATKLNSLLHKKFEDMQTEVVRFIVNDDFVIEYATNRFICPHCNAIFVDTKNSPSIPKFFGTCDFCNSPLKRREDDTPEVVQKRLDEYRQTEHRLLEFYDQKGQSVISLSMESTPNNPLSDQFDDFKNELGQKNGDL